MWVLKIGGSLTRSVWLPAWLDAARALPCSVVIVPGGGAFADEVRRFQQRWWISDEAAHRLAVSAMRQYGQCLLALDSELKVFEVQRFQATVSKYDACVWLPDVDATGSAVLPQNWGSTSDSLSLWLADKLGAEGVALVKHLPKDAPAMSWKRACEEKILDENFAGFVDKSNLRIEVLSARRPELLGKLI